jgi:hypothetical protein
VSEESLRAWHDDVRTGRPGAPRTYSDTAIVGMVWRSAVYKWALRGTQGLLVSVMQLLMTKVPVPDYTTLCRRRRTLEVSLPRRTRGEPLHVVVGTLPASKSMEKASGKCAAMGIPNDARGESCILGPIKHAQPFRRPRCADLAAWQLP